MDRIFSTQTPNIRESDGGTSRQLGVRVLADADGQVTGGRYYVPDLNKPTAAWWQLWEVTGATSGTLLTEVDLTAQTGWSTATLDDWFAFDLGSPVSLSNTVEYICCFWTLGGAFMYADPWSSFPLTSTPDSLLTADAAVFRNGSARSTYPLSSGGDAGTGTDFAFFADVDAEAGAAAAEGTSAFGVGVALAATGARESAGTTGAGLGLALAATGNRDSAGSTGLGLGLSLQAAGARPSQGTAAFAVGLGLAATGSAASGPVDLTVTVGPTRVRTLAEIAATRSRAPVAAAATRLGWSAGATRARALASAEDTRGRELATVGDTRDGWEVGDTRDGWTVGPTREREE